VSLREVDLAVAFMWFLGDGDLKVEGLGDSGGLLLAERGARSLLSSRKGTGRGSDLARVEREEKYLGVL